MERLKQHYELLRIKPGAHLNEIKQAYVLAEQKLHEDRLADDPLVRQKAQERLRKINQAYMEIMDAYKEVQASLKEGTIRFEPNRLQTSREGCRSGNRRRCARGLQGA